MATIEDIQDPAVRDRLSEAERALDDGDNLRAVQLSAAVYERLVAADPGLVVTPVSLGALPLTGRRSELRQRGPWPEQLGVHLDVRPDGTVRTVFDRDTFTLSEAIAYFEYTLDLALHPSPGR